MRTLANLGGGPVELAIPEVGRLRMFLHPDQDAFISPWLRTFGCWEPMATRLMLDIVKRGHTVVDVGANIGYYTLIMSRLVGPRGKVVAFEPEPRNFALLKDNIELNGLKNVELVQKAVTDRCAPEKLFLSSDNQGDHRLFHASSERTSCEVDAVSLDSCPLLKDAVVDFVKIDTQGAELRVLDGMVGIVNRSRGRLSLMMELSPRLLEMSGFTVELLLQRLDALQARVYWPGESGGAARLTPMGQQEIRGVWSIMSRAVDEGFYSEVFVRFG
jgi:FkbM family methyltransferase